MRIKKMNSLRENDLIIKQILSTNSSRKCTETSLENLYVDIGSERVITLLFMGALRRHI